MFEVIKELDLQSYELLELEKCIIDNAAVSSQPVVQLV